MERKIPTKEQFLSILKQIKQETQGKTSSKVKRQA